MPLFTVGQVLTAALANQLNMTPVAKAVNYTAVDGDIVVLTTGKVVTLPAATNQSRVLVYAGDANVANGFTAAGGAVVKGLGLGSGTAAGTLVPLGAADAFALCIADGTNWRIIAGNADSGWIALASLLAGAWVAGGITPQYRRRGEEVMCRGSITGGVAGSIFTLPTGFRPTNGSAPFIVTTFGGGTGWDQVVVATTGVGTMTAGTASSGTPTEVALDQVRFQVV